MDSKDKYVHSMDWGKNEFSFDHMKNYRKYQYDLIRKHIGIDILEVGSGDRSFTKQLITENPDIQRILSIEPSETLYEMHRSNFVFPEQVAFKCIDLFDLQVEETGLFDTAIFIHVLEHIKEDKKALDHVCNFVKPGGYVLFEVPAMPSLFSVHDEILGHYRRYNKIMLNSIIDIEKYEIKKLWYQDPIGAFGSWYFFKKKKIKVKSEEGLSLAKNQGGIYDKYVIPFEKQIEKLIEFPFGLSLTAILQKR